MQGLTELQSEILRRFFARREDFFLTGGATLVGFYLGHRETHDLDLFTEGTPLVDGERTLREIASELELDVESVRRDPAFHRFLVDSAEEILANKMCTLLSRVEVRDLVDVMALEQSGLDPIAAVWPASRKDAGVTPSQLAWVLSSFPIPTDKALPGDVSPDALRAFRDDLIRRLAATAFPHE
jgi:predicted nucleotidyltransferase component of viral defense system